jgi:GT2 family glycosyltransferase
MVYVVVLNWNNYIDTRHCLDSLENSGYPNQRIIVVDNSSRDGSAQHLQGEFPDLTFLLNPANLGFARGCNVGIREALKDRECAYVLLLNNDATISAGGLEKAVRFAENDSQIGVISGKILLSETQDTIWYAGGRIDRWRGRAVVRGFSEIDRGQYETPCEVGFATGALMLIKREVLEKVGLLPEEYFFGIEEWDYSLQVRQSGYRLYYAPEFVASHKADGSHWNYDPKFVYNSYRSKLIFQEKYLPFGLFPLWKLAFAFYGRHFARRFRQRLIKKYQYDKHREIPLEELDFALYKALGDHKKNVLCEERLQLFEEELVNCKTSSAADRTGTHGGLSSLVKSVLLLGRYFLRRNVAAAPLMILAGPFRGARLFLDPACSKRKVFGIYEHVLNSWWRRELPNTEVVWDVGAADGYFTFGCAHEIKRHKGIGHIVAFEPDENSKATLERVAGWPEYNGIEFEFMSQFVGASTNGSATTLDEALRDRPTLVGKRSLIKVDVEGDEIDVLKGASLLLSEPHQWVVEIHGEHLLSGVIELFKANGRSVDIINPEPHWLLGPECRQIKTRWVTTRQS